MRNLLFSFISLGKGNRTTTSTLFSINCTTYCRTIQSHKSTLSILLSRLANVLHCTIVYVRYVGPLHDCHSLVTTFFWKIVTKVCSKNIANQVMLNWCTHPLLLNICTVGSITSWTLKFDGYELKQISTFSSLWNFEKVIERDTLKLLEHSRERYIC